MLENLYSSFKSYWRDVDKTIFFSKENFDPKLLFENEAVVEEVARLNSISNYFAAFLDYLDDVSITNAESEFPIMTKGFEKQAALFINEFFENEYFSSYSMRNKDILNLYIKFCNTSGGQISIDNISRFIDEKIANTKEVKSLETLLKNVNTYNKSEENVIIEYMFEKIYDNKDTLLSLFFSVENIIKEFTKGGKSSSNLSSYLKYTLNIRIMNVIDSDLKDAALEYFRNIANSVIIDKEITLFFTAYMFLSLEKLHSNNYFDIIVKNNADKITSLYLEIIKKEDGILNTSYFEDKKFAKEILLYLNKKIGPQLKKAYASEFVSQDFNKMLISFLTNSEVTKFKLFYPSYIDAFRREHLNISSIIASILENTLSSTVINKSEIVKMLLHNDSYKVVFQNIGHSSDLNKQKKKVRKLMFKNLLLKSSDGRDLVLSEDDYKSIEKLLKNTGFRDAFRKSMPDDFKEKFAQTLFNSNVFIAPIFIVRLGLKEFYNKLILDSHIRKLIRNILRG